MNRIEEQLNTLKNLHEITLPEEKRIRLREELLAYAELHGVQVASAKPSPFKALRLRMYAGMSAAVLLIAALGGTAYASERALPGDPLYPVKVGFAEPLQTALVPSDRGKAAWHAILAERRLDEAAQLAASDDLSIQTQTELAENFDTHVNASEESADRLERNGDTAGSLSARSDLEARLAAHEQILAVIDAHFADASSTQAQDTHVALSRMLALVKDHEQAVASSRMALEDAIAPEAAKDDDATTSATVAIADVPEAPLAPAPVTEPLQPLATPAEQVETAAAVRTTEVKDILERHAALLAKFLPTASTTATSTATSTATTTEPEDGREAPPPETGHIQHAADQQDGQMDSTSTQDSEDMK